MFKKGDKVRRRGHPNADYQSGVILRIKQEYFSEVAEVAWSGGKVFAENWYLRSLESAEDPCDILKNLL